jgi:tyrosyl-tRNA synthetase
MGELIAELQERGLIEQLSDPELGAKLEAAPIVAYSGFDPTASSLHLGNLVPMTVLRHLQRRGHKVIALVGGATAMVGDPSGKAEERKLLSREEIEVNAAGVRAQLGRYLEFDGPNPATMVNNADWFAQMGYLDFLRDVGKHFSLGLMLGKESVKLRLEREQGISYTEFSYMLVQAYDYLHLFDQLGCTLQVGGSDQWGNITAGIELIRRARGATAYAATMPLITRADGAKFGKSEKGNVWLDAARTSPYEMYQFLLNSDDRDVERFLGTFTFLPIGEIEALCARGRVDPAKREAQRVLARELLTLVHGEAEAKRAEAAAKSLFGRVEVKVDVSGTITGGSGQTAAAELAAAAIDAARANGAPTTQRPRAELEAGVPLPQLIAQVRLCDSTSAARREIQGGGIYLNQVQVKDVARSVTAADLIADRFVLLRRGKRSFHIVDFA